MASMHKNSKRYLFSSTKWKHLQAAREVGAGARLSLDIEKLKASGWKVTKREDTSSGSSKMHFCFVNPQGKPVKSAKQVKEQLAEEGTLEEMLQLPAGVPRILPENHPASAVDESSSQSLDEQDADFDPPMKRAKSNAELQE